MYKCPDWCGSRCCLDPIMNLKGWFSLRICLWSQGFNLRAVRGDSLRPRFLLKDLRYGSEIWLVLKPLLIFVCRTIFQVWVPSHHKALGWVPGRVWPGSSWNLCGDRKERRIQICCEGSSIYKSINTAVNMYICLAYLFLFLLLQRQRLRHERKTWVELSRRCTAHD